MKKILIIFFIISNLSLIAQVEMKYNSNSEILEEWVQMMYAENPDAGEVINAYTNYYKENINVISIHTAQDVSNNGNADTLAKLFDLKNIKIFGITSKEKGVGRIGDINEVDSDSLRITIEKKLSTKVVRTNQYFKNQKNIQSIAFVPGSGTQFLEEILGKVDVFITGDVSHHHFLLADEYQMGVVQVNHISTEIPGMKNFTDKISESLNTKITYLHNEYYE